MTTYITNELDTQHPDTNVAEREQIFLEALPSDVRGYMVDKLKESMAALQEVRDYYQEVAAEMQALAPYNERLNAAVRKLAEDLRTKVS